MCSRGQTSGDRKTPPALRFRPPIGAGPAAPGQHHAGPAPRIRAGPAVPGQHHAGPAPRITPGIRPATRKVQRPQPDARAHKPCRELRGTRSSGTSRPIFRTMSSLLATAAPTDRASTHGLQQHDDHVCASLGKAVRLAACRGNRIVVCRATAEPAPRVVRSASGARREVCPREQRCRTTPEAADKGQTSAAAGATISVVPGRRWSGPLRKVVAETAAQRRKKPADHQKIVR